DGPRRVLRPGGKGAGSFPRVGPFPPGESFPRLLGVGCHDRLQRSAACGRPTFWLLTRQFTGDEAGLTRTVLAAPRRGAAYLAFTALCLTNGNLSRPGRRARE